MASAQSAPSRATVPTGEPAVNRIVVEDDQTRIEELRVRGQTERVVVRPKQGAMPAWEIRPDSPGRTGGADARLPRENASTRQWAVFRF